MKYNKTAIKNKISIKLKNIILNKTKYYILPKFKVSRDLDFNVFYKNYSKNSKFINLGAGEYFYHPRWINYDLYESSLVKKISNFKNYDLRSAKDTTFPESDVDVFYCAHTLEHIPAHNILYVLKRIFDSLKKDGVVRFVVPDADLIYKAYKENNADFFKIYDSWFKNRSSNQILLEDYLLQLIATPKCRFYTEFIRHEKALDLQDIKSSFTKLSKESFLDFLISNLKNNNDFGTDHLNWFNYEKLAQLLKEIGFSSVYQSAYGQSSVSIMRQVPIFDETLPCLSLYVEAVK